jgi:hypothetical protein
MEESWFRGYLKDLALTKVLRRLQMGTKTGILKVEKDGYIVNIFIRNGDVIFAASNSDEDRLGELLLKEEKITFEEYNQARNLIQTRRERMGRIFVELCCLTPEEVVLAVRHQVEEIVMNLFSLESGRYEFGEGALPSDEMITLHMSTASIIYRGIRRIRNVMLARKICPPEDGVLGLSGNPLNLFQEIDLDDRDKIILSYMKGKTLKMILSLSPMHDFDTMRTICALMSVGLVISQGEDDSPARVTAEDLLKDPEEGVSENFLVEIEEMLRGCDNFGCYEILGLKSGASVEEIESAYYRLSQRFHPDRHYSLPAHDIKERLIRIFSYITHAYEILMDPEKRDAYDRKPLLVKDAAPEEITEKMFAASDITGPDRESGETAGEIPAEAEVEAAVPEEEVGVSEGAGKTHEPAGAVGEMQLQQKAAPPSEAARNAAETVSEDAGEIREEVEGEAAVPVEEAGIAEVPGSIAEVAREIPEKIPADGKEGDLSEGGHEPFTVEVAQGRGRNALMPIAVIVVVVIVVAAAASLMFKDGEEVSLAPASPPASVEEEVNRDEPREASVKLPTFRNDLFRKFLNESGDRRHD